MRQTTSVIVRYDCPSCGVDCGLAQSDGMTPTPLRIRCLCGRELVDGDAVVAIAAADCFAPFRRS